MDVCLTTTAIDIVDKQICTICRINLQQQTFLVSHRAFITTAIEVVYLTLLQMPSGTDGHLGLVVTTKDTRELESGSGSIVAKGCNTHTGKEFLVSQQVGCSSSSGGYRRGNLTTIINIDVGSLFHSDIVSATIDISHSTTLDFEISLVQLRFVNIVNGFIANNHVVLAIIFFRICIVTIAATIYITYKDMVWLGGDGLLTFSCRCRFLRIDADEGIICVVNAVSFLIFNLIWQRRRCADGSGYIVTTIDRIYQYIVVVGSDVDKGRAFNVSLTGSAINTTANDNLRINIEH